MSKLIKKTYYYNIQRFVYIIMFRINNVHKDQNIYF